MPAAVIPERFTPVLAELAPLVERFADAGHQLYLVGGAVRDLLIGEPTDDFDYDLTTNARPGEVRACLEGWAQAIWEQGERFGTIGAKRQAADGTERTFEITTFRSEVYVDDSRKPRVTFSDRIEDDLGRRDFTINAIALELTGTAPPGAGVPVLVDPFGGAADLAQRVLRTPLTPEISFGDDPLRMLPRRPLHRPVRARARPRPG